MFGLNVLKNDIKSELLDHLVQAGEARFLDPVLQYRSAGHFNKSLIAPERLRTGVVLIGQALEVGD